MGGRFRGGLVFTAMDLCITQLYTKEDTKEVRLLPIDGNTFCFNFHLEAKARIWP